MAGSPSQPACHGSSGKWLSEKHNCVAIGVIEIVCSSVPFTCLEASGMYWEGLLCYWASS